MRLQTAAVLSTLFIAGVARADSRHLLNGRSLPAGTSIYIAPMSDHFDAYLLAGLQTKRVPVVVVTDRSKANYEVRGSSKSEPPGWKRMLFVRSDDSTEKAAVQVVDLATGDQVLNLSAYKLNSSRGMQSTGELLAMRLKRAIVEPTASKIHNGGTTNSPIGSLSKVYIEPVQDGFEGYLTAAIKQKGIPVIIVGSREEADFELTGHAELDKETTTQKVLLNDRRSIGKVRVQMVRLKTGQVVFAYASDGETWSRGLGKLATEVAKHLAKQIKSNA